MSNPYFNNSFDQNNNEFELYRQASDELCEMHGIDFRYIIKTLVNEDHIFGEDNLKNFDGNEVVTFLIENYENYDGVGDMFSKFGFSVDNKLTLLIEQKRFKSIIDDEPRVDDLVYHPNSEKIFQIKNVGFYDGFFQMNGGEILYRLTCEIFTPSHEDFNTDIEEVDAIASKTDSNNDLEDDQFDIEKIESLDFNERDIFNNL